MISPEMKKAVAGGSAIRKMFEEGMRLSAIYGKENVFDFSIGNPSTPAPDAVKDAIIDILENEDPIKVHGYMPNAGFPDVRTAIADSLNSRFGTAYDANNLIMTVGAACGLNIIFKTLLCPGDEVVAIAPYFMEYGGYATNYGGVLVTAYATDDTFQPVAEKLATYITPKTKAVILNTPNNPTGVIYTEETLKAVAEMLEAKQAEYGTDIYVVCDEPYRELAYNGAIVPWIPSIYRNTIVAYSWSKSLSLPGERIGYVVIPSEVADFEDMHPAMTIALRVSGFVNAPSLIQRAVAKCLDCQTDLAGYDLNRQTLYNGLVDLGFEPVYPDGAFYLWVKSPEADAKAFAAKAAKYNLLVVPGDGFSGAGYFRLSYCVSLDTIKNSLTAFAKVGADYGLEKK